MDKLLQLIEKLRGEIVPESPIATMSKPQLLQFIEESQFIERMRVFHQKGDRGIRSAITDDEDDKSKSGVWESFGSSCVPSTRQP